MKTIREIMNEKNYKDTDSGAMGKAIEIAIKEYLGKKGTVSASGKVDLRLAHKCYEIKTGAGELGLNNSKLLKGSTLVLYIPVVNLDGTIEEQNGYFIERDNFVIGLTEINMIREKISSKGIKKLTIQTFWNNSKNAPHGKGIYKLIDMLNVKSIDTLNNFLVNAI